MFVHISVGGNVSIQIKEKRAQAEDNAAPWSGSPSWFSFYRGLSCKNNSLIVQDFRHLISVCSLYLLLIMTKEISVWFSSPLQESCR